MMQASVCEVVRSDLAIVWCRHQSLGISRLLAAQAISPLALPSASEQPKTGALADSQLDAQVFGNGNATWRGGATGAVMAPACDAL